MNSPFCQGYLPGNPERRVNTLNRKRDEYLALVDQYYSTKDAPENTKDFHQVRRIIEIYLN